MANTAHIAAMVLVSAAITWALRALPFAILALYTVRGVPSAPALSNVAVGAALAVTIGLHLWRHNALLSIVGGTVVHVLVMSLL